jgi:hypothetical protein
MDFTGILGAIASGAGGGIIGGVLGLGKKFLADRHEKAMMKEKREERQADRDHDLDLADKEIERDIKAAESNLQQAMFEADSAALTTASSNQDAEITALSSSLNDSYKWVKSLAALMFSCVTVCGKMVRIVLTIALVYQTFDMFNGLNTALGGLATLPVTDLAAIFKKIIYSILSMTGMAVGFWFVARPEKANRQ